MQTCLPCCNNVFLLSEQIALECDVNYHVFVVLLLTIPVANDYYVHSIWSSYTICHLFKFIDVSTLSRHFVALKSINAKESITNTTQTHIYVDT